MNLLIVDDEPIIRYGLRTLIDWQHYGFHWAGEASDGVDALSKIKQGNIDILVTDIRMPRMDGIELIRRSRELGNSLGVLVLSCLDDFAYVKEAMKLGASDYILKPTMEPEELVVILESLRSQLLLERQEKQRLSEWQLELEQTKPYQLSAWIRQYLEHNTSVERLNEELFATCNSMYSLMIHWSTNNKLSLEYSHFPECLACVRLQKNSLFLLFPDSEDISDYGKIQTRLRQAEKVEATVRAMADGRDNAWSISLGSNITKIEDLTDSVSLHQRQNHQRFYSHLEKTIWDDADSSVETNSLLPYEQRNDLLKAITNNNVDAIYYQAELIGNYLMQSKPDLDRLFSFVLELMGLAVGYARSQEYLNMDDYEKQYVSMENIQSCFHINELRTWLVEAMRALWAHRWGSVTNAESSNPFIRKALRFMKEHYHHNIGTVDIAEYVKLSRSYLSDLYSKEMGESLIDTLTRIRMEEAKKKIISGDRKIYEIAQEVGFSDAKAFAKAFKRIVGCTPKEFDFQNK